MRSHVLPGFCVGGKGLSPGSMVTWRGFLTLPPRGPRSMYSPGSAGFSPGLWRDGINLEINVANDQFNLVIDVPSRRQLSMDV